MTDREYVESKWKDVSEEEQWSLREKPSEWHGFVLAGTLLLSSGNRKERWEAAAEFTRQCEEELRCLEREIECVYWAEISGRKHPNHMAIFGWSEEDVFRSSRNLATWSRIRERLKRELERLKEGMK